MFTYGLMFCVYNEEKKCEGENQARQDGMSECGLCYAYLPTEIDPASLKEQKMHRCRHIESHS